MVMVMTVTLVRQGELIKVTVNTMTPRGSQQLNISVLIVGLFSSVVLCQ